MKRNLVFVTAQPDVPYFHWQARIYIHNFIEKGINPEQIHVIFAMVQGNKTPSKESLELKSLGVNIHHYLDERISKMYIPSIKPFLIYKWLEQFPEYGECFFLHDADIIFRELPDFDKLINDEVVYLSDTIGYIGYNYIKDCCNRYEKQHPSSKKEQLLNEMAFVVGIDVESIKNNQENSGGGQYIIKGTSSVVWEKIYLDCTPLYNQMLDYQKRFPIHPGEIQFWTAEMWSLLWNLWYFGVETKVVSDLSFSWATDSMDIYKKHPILHMAGVTEKLKENINFFDFIDENSSTTEYIKVMKSIIKNNN
jgi:hypothetical protein